MKNILVETTGAFMLMTRFGEVSAFRPSVIKHSQEINQFVSQDQIKVLHKELPENADDAGFYSFYKAHDKDWEAALENYIHSLEGTGEDSLDYATKDGATKDDATKDGATKDDATKDGATKDDATKDGATKDGATKPTTRKTGTQATKAQS